jgi:hypothetical protein
VSHVKELGTEPPVVEVEVVTPEVSEVVEVDDVAPLEVVVDPCDRDTAK